MHASTTTRAYHFDGKDVGSEVGVVGDDHVRS